MGSGTGQESCSSGSLHAQVYGRSGTLVLGWSGHHSMCCHLGGGSPTSIHRGRAGIASLSFGGKDRQVGIGISGGSLESGVLGNGSVGWSVGFSGKYGRSLGRSKLFRFP